VSEQTTAIRIRVECNPFSPDAEFPIRLRVVGDGDVLLTELKFTPTTAREAASSVGRLMGYFLPSPDSRKLASALRTAAARVWATRN